MSRLVSFASAALVVLILSVVAMAEHPFTAEQIERQRRTCAFDCLAKHQVSTALGNREASQRCTEACKADPVAMLMRKREGKIKWCMGLKRLANTNVEMESFRAICAQEVDEKGIY